MAFGFSFGKKKTTTDQDLFGTQLESSTQNQSSTQAQTGTTTQSASGTTSASGTSTQAGTSTTQQQQVGTERQAGTTSLFSDPVLAALEAAGLGRLGAASGAAAPDLSGLAFDSNSFVSNAVTRAAAAAQQQRQIAEGGLFDSLGGTGRGNTMAALLQQQLAIQEQGAVAGARNDAVKTANEIARGNIGTELAVQGQDQGFVAQLLGLLRGGQQVSNVATDSSTTGSTTAQTQQQESQSQVQQSESTNKTINDLLTTINALISGSGSTTTDQQVSGVTKGKGGGFSLAL